MNIDKKDIIKMIMAISSLVVIILLVIISIIQYQIEGEKNMPYKLSKIAIISTAEGEQNTLNKEENAKWNLSINQNNDIYFFIDKNTTKEDVIIEKVTIENINFIKTPLKGTIKTYMPNSLEGRTFVNKEDFEVNGKVEYLGGKSSNSKTLEIGNQGGTILIRFSNMGVGNFISNEEQEVKHDGTILTKIGVKDEEVSFKVNFDFIIQVNKIKYKANITLDLPNNNISLEGTTTKEIDYKEQNLNNIVFKRIK